MINEIERKFLVSSDYWQGEVNGAGTLIKQGYLFAQDGKSVRIRTSEKGGLPRTAWITIKTEVEKGVLGNNLEYEYVLPIDDAENLLKGCGRLVTKFRYIVRYDGLSWEVNNFIEENKGLVMAEIELSKSDQKIKMPSWIGKEVTADARYYNSNLAKNPFKFWKENNE